MKLQCVIKTSNLKKSLMIKKSLLAQTLRNYLMLCGVTAPII